MDLKTTQSVLSRLYTDGEFRKMFIIDSNAALKAIGLDRDDAKAVARLCPQQLEFFADSLIRKRLGEVNKLLPLTRSVLGEVFETLFRRYATKNHLEIGKPFQKDAIRFCRFLKAEAERELSNVSWGIDALRFETTQLTAVVSGRYFFIRLLRYPVQTMVRSVAEFDSVPKRVTLAIWLCLGSSRSRRFLAIGYPFWRKGRT